MAIVNRGLWQIALYWGYSVSNCYHFIKICISSILLGLIFALCAQRIIVNLTYSTKGILYFQSSESRPPYSPVDGERWYILTQPSLGFRDSSRLTLFFHDFPCHNFGFTWFFLAPIFRFSWLKLEVFRFPPSLPLSGKQVLGTYNYGPGGSSKFMTMK